MDIPRSIHLRSSDGRLLLRPYELADAAEMCQAVIASRAELSPWMDWCIPQYAIQDTRQWLKSLPGAWERREIYGFGVFDAGNEQFLGGCGLNHILWDYKLANLGYWVRSERTRDGIATQAAITVAAVRADNGSARTVPSRAGSPSGLLVMSASPP